MKRSIPRVEKVAGSEISVAENDLGAGLGLVTHFWGLDTAAVTAVIQWQKMVTSISLGDSCPCLLAIYVGFDEANLDVRETDRVARNCGWPLASSREDVSLTVN